MAVQYAQNYLHQKHEEDGDVKLSASIVKLRQGEESEAFKQAINQGV